MNSKKQFYNGQLKSELWHGDCLDVVDKYIDGDFTLLLTSTPYPGQRGFDLSVNEYFTWLIARVTRWARKLDPKRGVLVLNIMFKRTDDGWFDVDIFQIPIIFRGFGLHCVDTYIWDKLNSPPSGNHDRHDRNEYEFCFTFARSPEYRFNPQRAPYSPKTVGKSKAGNMRKPDIAGSHAGGHMDLHPDGARQSNMLRISSSGDQNRPRVEGGVFPRQLADRFILTFTEPGDAVMDICMGSGTTVVQAIRHGRVGHGIDTDLDAINVAEEWIKETLADMALPLFDH